LINYFLFNYKEHPLTYSSSELKDLPEEIISLLKYWEVEYSDKVIVATENNNIIGFFRYDLGNKRPWLYAAGTYVIPQYRNQNIAHTLWTKAILKENPNKILAHIASYGGLKIVNKIQKEFPKIIFDYTLDEKVSAA
jgi:hypothetical protein